MARRRMQYEFRGTTPAIEAASRAHAADAAAQAQRHQANMAAGAARATAQGGVLESIYNQTGPIAQAIGNTFGSHANAASGMFGTLGNAIASANNNYAQMFDAYGRNAGRYFDAVGNLGANAMAQAGNIEQGRYNAYSQGNTAYQNLLGQLGVAALGSFGSATNAAMQSQAMNSTAALKAMADAAGQNQSATAALGQGRYQALAALAAARGNAGTGFANARAANSAASGQLGGQGAIAYSNLGSSLGTAAGNLAALSGQSEASMRGAGAGALGNISAAESSGLAGIGSAASQALAGLAPSMALSAGNDLNYTRDMAKLGLAREMGLVGANIAGSMGGGGLDNTVSIYGPDGMLAEGSYGAVPTGGGGYRSIDPYANTPWYASRQDAGGRGLAALSGLQSQIASGSESQAAGLRGAAGASRGDLNRSLSSGSGNINAARRSGMAQIDAEGQSARGGIGAALLAAQNQIAESGRGIDSDAVTTYGGLDRTGQDIMSNDMLDALNANYGSSMSQLQNAFAQGQRDPREIYDQTLSGLERLMNPLVQRGADAMRDYYGGFPSVTTTPGAPGSSLNPQPYFDELRRAYDPYISNLNDAFSQQNNRIGSNVNRVNQNYRTGINDLGTRMDGTQGKLIGMFDTLMNDHVGRILPGGYRR